MLPNPSLTSAIKLTLISRLAQIQIGKGRRARRKRFIRRLRQQLTSIRLRPREEFERVPLIDAASAGSTLSFFRNAEIYRSDVEREPTEADSPDHRFDESPAGYSSAGYSPAEPASASPAEDHSGGEDSPEVFTPPKCSRKCGGPLHRRQVRGALNSACLRQKQY